MDIPNSENQEKTFEKEENMIKTSNDESKVEEVLHQELNSPSQSTENESDTVVLVSDTTSETTPDTEPVKANDTHFKDVERDIYEMLEAEERIYVSKTRKIIQFILFMILIVVGGFLVLLSRGLLFAKMASDTTTSHLAGHGLNVNGK